MILLAALTAVALSTPQPVAELDAGKLKGELARLAWSEDGSEFYVQTVERDKTGNVKAQHHFVVSVAARTAKDVGQEPPWAAKYWQWKAGQASPAASGFRIEVSERTETARAVSAPTGGTLARGGTADPSAGTSLSDMADAANTSQTVHIYSLKTKGETIGEWTNAAVTPGTNFSWAPAPLQLLVFAKREGGPIVVIDPSGAKQELQGTRAALLPAWSGDGKRIAWLERKGKTYQLTIAEVSTQ